MTRDEIINKTVSRDTDAEIATILGYNVKWGTSHDGKPSPYDANSAFGDPIEFYTDDCDRIDEISEWLKKHGEAFSFSYCGGVWTASLFDAADYTAYEAEAQTIAHAASLLVLMVHYDCKATE